MSPNARPLFFGLKLLCAITAPAVFGQPWPEPIRHIEERGVTIVKQFDAPGGMTGYAARAGNRPLALYLTPDGKHVILGTMLDAEGNDVSTPILEEAIKPVDLQQSWPQLEQAHWVADGSGDAERIVYVFTDPNCAYCHRFHEVARPWVESGRVQLRHIMVGIIKPSSTAKAAAILGADDPAAALARHERHYRRGGIDPLADIPTPLRRRVTANNRLMSSLGIQGTPGIVYRNDAGRIGVKQGLPQGALRDEILGPRN